MYTIAVIAAIIVLLAVSGYVIHRIGVRSRIKASLRAKAAPPRDEIPRPSTPVTPARIRDNAKAHRQRPTDPLYDDEITTTPSTSSVIYNYDYGLNYGDSDASDSTGSDSSGSDSSYSSGSDSSSYDSGSSGSDSGGSFDGGSY
jgi:uncharacterized membrane protein YgcG